MKHYDYAVTITGAGGFVGSTLVRAFLESEHDVRVFGADVPGIDLKRIVEFEKHEDFTYEQYNVMQPLHSDLLAVDTLYHFAGIANPERYLTQPIEVMDLNLYGLRNILDRVIRWSRGRPRIVFSSTSEVYGKSGDVPFNEEETDLVFGPTQKSRWCYAMSKAVSEHYLHAFGDQVPYTIFRFFNFVGKEIDAPGAGRVITKMVGDAMDTGCINVTAPGTQTRCFTYEDDFVNALVLPTYLKKLKPNFRSENHVINLGSDEEVTMMELAAQIRAHLRYVHDRDCEIKVKTQEEMYGKGYDDVRRRVPDTRAAKRILEWEPSLSIDEFLPDIIDATVQRFVLRDEGS